MIAMFPAVQVMGKEQKSTVTVEIPQYDVVDYDNYSSAVIQGGETLATEEGRPTVPYFIKYVDFPANTKIQDVTIVKRSDPQNKQGTGLKLAPVSFDILAYTKKEVKMIDGWYPQKVFDWKINNKDDGTIQLAIIIYPFFYEPSTTNVNFYKQYQFEVTYISSDTKITSVTTDKKAYKAGETIKISSEFENPSDEKDLVLGFQIKDYATDKVIESLPLKSLKKLSGAGSFNTQWNTGKAGDGTYVIEATIFDSSGIVLDKKKSEFDIYSKPKE